MFQFHELLEQRYVLMWIVPIGAAMDVTRCVIGLNHSSGSTGGGHEAMGVMECDQGIILSVD